MCRVIYYIYAMLWNPNRIAIWFPTMTTLIDRLASQLRWTNYTLCISLTNIYPNPSSALSQKEMEERLAAQNDTREWRTKGGILPFPAPLKKRKPWSCSIIAAVTTSFVLRLVCDMRWTFVPIKTCVTWSRWNFCRLVLWHLSLYACIYLGL